MSALAASILIVYAWYWFIVVRRIGFFTADVIFASIQVLMAIGSLALLDPGVAADRAYAPILAYTAICFMVVSGAIHLLSTRSPSEAVAESDDHAAVDAVVPNWRIWSLLLFSIAISIAYFRAVGYSALLAGANGNGADVATLRLNSYSGSRYLAPGYVNQFKNSLLPALSIVVVTHWSTRRMHKRLLATLLIGFSILALLWTGQRGALVVFGVVALAYFRYLDRKRFVRRALTLVAIGFPALIFVTLVLGRGENLGPNASTTEKVASSVSQLQYRITGSNQESGVAGFRYTYTLPTQNGAEWLSSLGNVLPGHGRGLTLSNEIYASVFGTPRGTDPPSLWGSIFFNFGYPGIVIAPFILAMLLARITRLQQSCPRPNTLEAIGSAGVVGVVGLWAAGDPTYLLNTGIVPFIFLWWWGRRVRLGRSRLGIDPSAEDTYEKIPIPTRAATARTRSGASV